MHKQTFNHGWVVRSGVAGPFAGLMLLYSLMMNQQAGTSMLIPDSALTWENI